MADKIKLSQHQMDIINDIHKDLNKETRYFSDEKNCLFFDTDKSYQ